MITKKGREIPFPGPPEYEASKALIIGAIECWEDPVLKCNQEAGSKLSNRLVGTGGVLSISISPRFRRLLSKVDDLASQFLEQRIDATKNRIETICQMELDLFTMNALEVQHLRRKMIKKVKTCCTRKFKQKNHCNPFGPGLE